MTTPLTDSEVAALRAVTPGAEQVVHLNHAGSSLPSRATLDRQIDHLRLEAQIGGYEAADQAAEDDAGVYESIAQLVGAATTEISRHEHATSAWNHAFWSLPMRPGQRILTAMAAYGSNAVGYLRAKERYGVEIDVVPNDEHGQLDVGELANRLDDDVAVIAITHMPTNGGLINPAAAVGRLAREADVPYLLDACQSVGQLDIDVETIGCDLSSATGRKYLRGPRGTGFLYTSQRILDRLVVDHPDLHGVRWDRSHGYTARPTARRFRVLGVCPGRMAGVGYGCGRGESDWNRSDRGHSPSSR